MHLRTPAAESFHLFLAVLGGVVTALAVDAAPAQAPPATRRARPEPKTYFVAPTGNDGHPGTAEQPWKTIQRATDVLAPGDTVRYDSSSSPEVFSRAVWRRCCALSQFAMFQNALT